MELKWQASLPASALHATDAVLAGKTLVDEKLATAMAQPARKFQASLSRENFDYDRVMAQLIPLAAGITGPLQLAEVALMKVAGRTQAAAFSSRLSELLRQLYVRMQSIVPDLLEQLALRGGPIRQQWESRGPGMLGELGRLIGAEMLVPHAEVVLVYPVLGGGGRAFLPYNTVVFEALLADPQPALPEVVRLAWLLAQLHCDLPVHQGDLKRDELAAVAEAAMIPAALTAAQEVELARCDVSTVRLALDTWPPGNKISQPEQAQTLLDWWDTYLAARPKWSVSLGALAQMLTKNT